MSLAFRRRGAALGLAALLALAACSDDDSSSDATVDPPANAGRGVALTPASFDQEGFETFLERAEEAGTLLAHYGDWAELDDEGSAFEVVVVEGRRRDLEPMIAVSPFDQGDGELIRPLDEATVDSYRAAAVDFVTDHQPLFFGIGVEGNLLASKNPDAFEQFVEVFAEIAPEVREASPATRVFTTFELEWMQGYRGGAFGGTNDPSNTQWELLDRFPDADLLAFSTHPSLSFETPADIPADLYSSILDHTEKPVAFTEAGWAVDSVVLDWESSEAEQAEFAERLLGEVERLDARFAIWTFLYPPDDERFDSMSLRTIDDQPRPVWSTWTSDPRAGAE